MTEYEARALLRHCDEAGRDDWERTRLVAFSSLRPYLSRDARPTDLMKFPWDAKTGDTAAPTDEEIAAADKWFEQYKHHFSNESK